MENHRTQAFASKFCPPPHGSLAAGATTSALSTCRGW